MKKALFDNGVLTLRLRGAALSASVPGTATAGLPASALLATRGVRFTPGISIGHPVTKNGRNVSAVGLARDDPRRLEVFHGWEGDMRRPGTALWTQCSSK